MNQKYDRFRQQLEAIERNVQKQFALEVNMLASKFFESRMPLPKRIIEVVAK